MVRLITFRYLASVCQLTGYPAKFMAIGNLPERQIFNHLYDDRLPAFDDMNDSRSHCRDRTREDLSLTGAN